MRTSNGRGDSDEMDEALFASLREHAVKHCPNPNRIDCPSRETLKRFVTDPKSVSVQELGGWHIMECAECTKDLEVLRSTVHTAPHKLFWGASRFRMWTVAASVFAAIVLVAFLVIPLARKAGPLPLATVSISLDDRSIERGEESGPVLPRSKVLLLISLPETESVGEYEVTLSKQRETVATTIRSKSSPEASGSHQVISARMDLSGMEQGSQWLGVTNLKSGHTWYCLVRLQ